MSGLFVNHLSLKAFRSYERLRLDDIKAPFVVLTGGNGAGKTNILEALSLLSPGRGLRQASLKELRLRGAGVPWVVHAKITAGSDDHQVGTGEDETTARRLIRLNGEAVRASESLARLWSVLWLTPQMDRLFLESAGGRRRFLDRLVMGLHSDHGRAVAHFERLMRERNRLLSEGRFEAAWLEALERQMADYAIAIVTARVDYAGQLMGQIVDQLADKSRDQGAERRLIGLFPKPEIILEGDGEAALLNGEKPIALEAYYRQAWRDSRRRDSERGRTSIGPHRSDLQVFYAEKSMPAAHCSTGEQKALLLALILANARLLRLLKGQAPLMLLDEITAHLDVERRTALFEILAQEGSQVWLTGTERVFFEGLEDRAQYYKVQESMIEETI